jgi:osmotically-inducible protein OsmY
MSRAILLLLNILVTTFFLFALQSCTTIVGSSIITASYMSSGSKTYSQRADDMKIFLKVKDNILTTDYTMTLFAIDIKVHNGNVYMVGRVKNNKTREDLIKEVAKIEGVSKIYDEIVVDSRSSSLYTFCRSIYDSAITIKTRMLFLFNRDIRSANYSVETFNGTVYIVGDSKDYAEYNRVSKVSSKGFGVKKIVNYSTVSNN